LGNHGAAMTLAREQVGLAVNLRSDAASVLPIAGTMMRMPELHFMRDPSHGGLATVAQETPCVAAASVRLFAQQLPISDQVVRFCEMLGCDPM
jgi:hydrogenase expression/formation protein HypE